MKTSRLCLFLILSSLARTPAQSTLVAHFDDLPEGGLPSSFISGGIHFSAPYFAVDAAIYNLPGFSAPNVITFGGLSEGPGFAMTPMRSFRMSFPPVLAERAEFDLFSFQEDYGAVAYELLAFNGTNLVASNSIPVAPPGPIYEIRRQHLALGCAAPFDSLRVQVTPVDTFTVVVMDNVEVTPVGAVPPPQLRRIKLPGPNAGFEISGHPGRHVTLEASRHQQTWKTLVTTNIPDSGTLTLKVRRATAHRFYRLQEICP